jgi:hypothetical protein
MMPYTAALPPQIANPPALVSYSGREFSYSAIDIPHFTERQGVYLSPDLYTTLLKSNSQITMLQEQDPNGLLFSLSIGDGIARFSKVYPEQHAPDMEQFFGFMQEIKKLTPFPRLSF